MVGIFIQNEQGSMYVLTKGDSNDYPDLQEITSNGELESLKLNRTAKKTAKQVFTDETGEKYPQNNDNTHIVLKKLFDKVIGE